MRFRLANELAFELNEAGHKTVIYATAPVFERGFHNPVTTGVEHARYEWAVDRTFRERPEVYLKIVSSISPKQYEMVANDQVGSYSIEWL